MNKLYKYVVLGFFDEEQTMPTQTNCYTLEEARQQVPRQHEGCIYEAIYIEGSVYASEEVTDD